MINMIKPQFLHSGNKLDFMLMEEQERSKTLYVMKIMAILTNRIYERKLIYGEKRRHVWDIQVEVIHGIIEY